jgi:O-antigen/teichoic acid export membrane protein
MHLFPAIGAQKENASVVARTVERTAVVAVVMIIPVILVLFAFRAQVLELMFKKDFLPATEYLGAMLASGILRIYALVLGVGLLAAGFRRDWFIASLITTVVYFVGIWIGFSFRLGIYALPLAFGVGLALQAVYAWFAFRKQLGKFDPRFAQQTLIFTLFTILLVISIFWTWMLIVIALGYLFFLFRYNLIQETRVRVYDFLQRAAP